VSEATRSRGTTSAAEFHRTGSHRWVQRSRLSQRLRWIALVVGVAVTTVAVPPLIARSPRHPGTPHTTGTIHSSAAPGGSATPSTNAPVQSASPATPVSHASAAAIILTPVSLTTTAGFIGAGQSVLSLAVRDLAGTTDDWDRYVEFSRRYVGYLTYLVPARVAPASIVGITVEVNYRGPAASAQTWTFWLRDWHSNAWVPVGTNEMAPDRSTWKTLTFVAPGTPSDYVSLRRILEVQLSGGPQDDAADVDYLTVVLNSK
jgi:hypothetical protein